MEKMFQFLLEKLIKDQKKYLPHQLNEQDKLA